MSWIKNPGTDPSRSCVARLGQSRFLEFPRQQPIIVEIQGLLLHATWRSVRRASADSQGRMERTREARLFSAELCVFGGSALKSNHDGTEERRMARGRAAVPGRNLPQGRISGCSVRPGAGSLDALRRTGSGATIPRPKGHPSRLVLSSLSKTLSPLPRLHPFGGHAMMDALSGTAQGSGDSVPRGGTILSAGFSG